MLVFRNILKFGVIGAHTLLCILISIPITIVTFNAKTGFRIARKVWSPVVLGVLGITLDVKGRELIDFSKTHIFISNHQSFADIPVLFHVLDLNLYFVAKDELKKIPFLGWYMLFIGMIFVKRGVSEKSKQSMLKAAEHIRKDKNVVVFPEGTRGNTDQIAHFKRGAFLLSLNSGVEIVPIAISGTIKVWPKELSSSKGNLVHIRIGRPISPTAYSKEQLDEFIEDCKQKVLELKV